MVLCYKRLDISNPNISKNLCLKLLRQEEKTIENEQSAGNQIPSQKEAGESRNLRGHTRTNDKFYE